MIYTLPKLPYSFDSLEPHLDSKTMEIHYTKHHQAYVDKLNQALEKHPELSNKSLNEMLMDPESIPEDIRTAVKNNGGGHFNHSFYWSVLSPTPTKSSEAFSAAISCKFKSFDLFKEEFLQKAISHFASGWAWLVLNNKIDLEIITTPNHETPLALGYFPLLVVDLWEHAYYLKFQNRRAEFLEAWWQVINWKKVDELFNMGMNA